MPSSRKQARFCFTLFDYEDHTFDISALDNGRIRYLCFGEELCPTTSRRHLQGFIIYGRPTLLKDANALDFDNRAHLTVARGSTDENIIYCSKDGSFTEFGIRPLVDELPVDRLIARMEEKSITMERIVLELPKSYHQYGRTLERAADIILSRNVRDFAPDVYWLWGPTGSGKTREAIRIATENPYWFNLSDKGWQDGYTGQYGCIIDDFRGSIPYDELLRMLDRYPYSLSRRGRMPIPFLSRVIVITSSMPPAMVYKKRSAQDGIEQLLRRLTEVTEVGGRQGNSEPALSPEELSAFQPGM